MRKILVASSIMALSASGAIAGPLLDELAESFDAEVAFTSEDISDAGESYTEVVFTPRDATAAAITVASLTISEEDGIRYFEAEGIVSQEPDNTVELATLTASGSPEAFAQLSAAADSTEVTDSDAICEGFSSPAALEISGAKATSATQTEVLIETLAVTSELVAPNTCVVDLVLSLAGMTVREPTGVVVQTESLEIIGATPANSQLPTEETGTSLGASVTLTNVTANMGETVLGGVEFLQLYLDQDADSSINVAKAGYNAILAAMSATDPLTAGEGVSPLPAGVNVGAVWNASMEVFAGASIAVQNFSVSPEGQTMLMGMPALPASPSSLIVAAYKDGPSAIAVGAFENDQLGSLYLDFGLEMTAVDEAQLEGASSDALFALMPFGFTQLQASFEDRGIGVLATLVGFDPYMMAEQSAGGMFGPEKAKIIRDWLNQAQTGRAAISIGSEKPLRIEETMLAAMGSWTELPESVSVETEFTPPTVAELISDK